MARALVSATATLVGRGLHSGRRARLTILPAPVGAGWRLRRLDGPGRGAEIPVALGAVRPAPRRTVLGLEGGAVVSTVEHVLSALVGLEIADAVLAVEGEEVPVLDGSALPFARALLAVSRPVAPGSRLWRVRRGCSVRAADGGCCHLLPDEDLVIDCGVEFAHPAIGRQALTYRLSAGPEVYLARLAPARTFGFLAEEAQLRARALARGANLRSVLVLGSRGPLAAAGTRFADEVVRHKIVDALGDLALLGRPLRARLKLRRCSHALLVATLRRAVATGALAEDRR